ncbi:MULTISPECIES: PLP-dependent aminotransferase family protein [unclassified Nocardioides]|uniref:aminotransferase-like domain-containing protein n=1 Tax=unclassified Nocardioides TaxID=2615069 RepID=UPI0000EB6383|nr:MULTISPECIES: PLP-dependent aminotransferase family protein [unclassified Nocardioides]ABL82968.1 transcriptional regulator, GntR family [Nocardioides sp. JS614]
MPTLPLRLDRDAPGPLGVQLSGRIRDLVLAGTLARGDRLPSTRALAAELGVSRAVTEQAYEQLLAEGWLTARRGAGTFVAADGSGRAGVPPRPTPARPGQLVRLDAGTPWIDPRHAAGWRRAWREVSTARPPRGYDDPRGLPELRAALADRLARTRGLVVHPDEVAVVNGTTDGLRHLLTASPPGPVALEDPGYRAAVETVRGLGRAVRDLPALAPVTDLTGVAAAYVTPAHQHPLGRVLPGPERVALLAAADAAGTLVVEDDYDSEFRYDVAPVPALASLDRNRVAYLGTAAKSVAPTLRLGWLVAPPELGERVQARRVVTHEGAPWPVQRAYLALLRDGYVDQVVRTARRVYAERAPRVAAALAPYAELAGPLAGMYSTWLLPAGDAVRARDAARGAGFEVNLLADYCRSATLTGLVVGFGGVTDEELDRALSALVSAL